MGYLRGSIACPIKLHPQPKRVPAVFYRTRQLRWQTCGDAKHAYILVLCPAEPQDTHSGQHVEGGMAQRGGEGDATSICDPCASRAARLSGWVLAASEAWMLMLHEGIVACINVRFFLLTSFRSSRKLPSR